jgi:formamidopyrimidine-DNA glycosylase
MPELPEVETVMRGLAPHLTGKTVTKLTLNRKNLRYPFDLNMHQLIENRVCVGLRRRGKYIWMDMDNGHTLVIHLCMSGSFGINPKQSNKHDHVEFITEENTRLVYNDPRRFGMMYFVATGDEKSHPSFTKMGVEPLGNGFNATELRQKLKSKETPIKVALLDQSVVAGVGNIYACEALYLSGISPLKPASSIKGERLERLVQSIRRVLTDAIESGGSTLRDHRQTDGTMGYFQHNFKVYDREGDRCQETGGFIKKIVQGGRSTFYCPAKQR